MHPHLTPGAAFQVLCLIALATLQSEAKGPRQDLYVAGSQERCLHKAVAHLMHTIQPNTTKLQMPMFPYHRLLCITYLVKQSI